MTRALLTETERERIAGDADVPDQRRYEAVSRVRRRIHEELSEDVDVLRDHAPELYEELQSVACEE